MKIVIADGRHEADYIIRLFNERKNELIVINENEDNCRYLSLNNGLPVMCGRCTRQQDLREAGAENCDLFLALSDDDHKNYVACKAAKKWANAKRCIALVSNPKNVNTFKKLGLDAVVSSTYLLGEQVRNITSIENMVNSLSLDEKIIISEIKITDDLEVAGKTLSEINISDLGTISCINRQGKYITPNGQTRIEADDKVLVVTTVENQKKILAIFQRKK